jgi:hypothetical protein
MLSHLHGEKPHIEARFIYSTKVPSVDTQPSEVLFLPELLELFRRPRAEKSKHRLELFLTSARDGTQLNRRDDVSHTQDAGSNNVVKKLEYTHPSVPSFGRHLMTYSSSLGTNIPSHVPYTP